MLEDLNKIAIRVRNLFANWMASERAGSAILKASFWTISGTATSRLVMLIGMIAAARIIGVSDFGRLAILQSAIGMFGYLAGIGLGGTATRFVAKHAAIDKSRAGSTIAVVLLFSGLCIFVSVVLLFAFSRLFMSSLFEEDQLLVYTALAATLLASSAFRGVQNGIYAGLEQFREIAALNLLETAITFFSIIGLSLLFGLSGTLAGLFCGPLLVALLAQFRIFSSLRVRGIEVRFARSSLLGEVKIIWGYAVPSTLANVIAAPVAWYGMRLLADTPHGFEQLGVYNAAYQWHGPMIFLPMAVMTASIPTLVKAWESRRFDEFRRIIRWILSGILLITVPPCLLAGVMSPWIMSAYGDQFIGGGLVLICLLAAAPFHAISKVCAGALYGMNKAKLVLNANLLWAACLLALSLFLIEDYGALGLAISFLFAYLVQACYSTILAYSTSKYEH